MKVLLGWTRSLVCPVVFGDIFLEDLREYREKKLALVGMNAIFPIWKRDTLKLVNEFINIGFKGRICCIAAKNLSEDFCGRDINKELLEDLPDSVDPCGENGEYHSFVYDGPIFNNPLIIKTGEMILRDVRYFTDLLPAKRRSSVRRRAPRPERDSHHKSIRSPADTPVVSARLAESELESEP